MAEAAISERDGNGELTLLARVRAGDRDAQELLLQRYERTIAAMSWDLAPLSSAAEPLREDLYIAGCEGFCAACRRYDPGHPDAKGLWPFAYWHVRGPMIVELRIGMELSDDARSVYGRIKACRDELLQQLGREPNVAELAACARTTLNLVREVFAGWARTTFSDVSDSEARDGGDGREISPADEFPVVGTNPRPIPHPEEVARVVEWHDFVRQAFASVPSKALKFLTLAVLDQEDYSQEYSAQYLAKKGPHPLAQSWPEICAWYHLDGTLPATWSAICDLFATPPPSLNRQGLATFMTRCRRVLREVRDEAAKGWSARQDVRGAEARG